MKIWKKTAALLTATLLCVGVGSMPTLANTVPATVHIGLTSIGSGLGSISTSNQTITIGAEENGVYIEGGTLQSDSGFTFAVGSGNYGTTGETFTSYESAKTGGGIPAYIGGGQWTCYIAGGSGVSDTANMILVQANGSTLAIINGVTAQIGTPEGIVMVEGKEYRGRIQLTRVNGGNITPVNAISMEEYLYGVIPAEMPSSYETEALKAQAVAARTYTMTKMKAHAASGYELCDGVHCQVYKGYAAEQPSTNAAVDATKGLLAYYQGVPIEAVFSASSGGYTENTEDVWNAPVAYLRAVPDVYEVDTNTWTKEVTAEALTNLTSSKGDTIGQVTDLVIGQISQGGRVQELRIVGTSGTKTLVKDEIRTYFSGVCGSLPSKMFTINGQGATGTTTVAMTAKNTETPTVALENYALPLGSDVTQQQTEQVTVTAASSQVINTADGTGTFVIEGKGNGHGVGLSQKGAQGMALQGFDFKSILQHYYTGITVE